jgi:hypothetical protein
MKRIRPFLGVLACVSVMAATLVSVAHADAPRATWTFTECTGPAGTPSTFDALGRSFTTGSGIEKGAVNWFLTSGTATFTPKVVTILDTGDTFSLAAGFDNNNVPLVTCETIGPVSGTHYLFSGVLTPIGAH